MQNPWNIQSLYEFQYFNCPKCIFKDQSKQGFVNHAYELHPESIEYLINIDDKSITGIVFPLIEQISEIKKESNETISETEDIRGSEIKSEEYIIVQYNEESNHDINDPLDVIKMENDYDNHIMTSEEMRDYNCDQCEILAFVDVKTRNLVSASLALDS